MQPHAGYFRRSKYGLNEKSDGIDSMTSTISLRVHVIPCVCSTIESSLAARKLRLWHRADLHHELHLSKERCSETILSPDTRLTEA
jgi:hypothetical protein